MRRSSPSIVRNAAARRGSCAGRRCATSPAARARSHPVGAVLKRRTVCVLCWSSIVCRKGTCQQISGFQSIGSLPAFSFAACSAQPVSAAKPSRVGEAGRALCTRVCASFDLAALSQRSFGRALAGRDAVGARAVARSASVGVEPLARDAGAASDALEADRRALVVELAQRLLGAVRSDCSRYCALRHPRTKGPRPTAWRVSRPPHEQLIRAIAETSWSAVGRKYGVSDNAVRKWVRSFERQLPTTD